MTVPGPYESVQVREAVDLTSKNFARILDEGTGVYRIESGPQMFHLGPMDVPVNNLKTQKKIPLDQAIFEAQVLDPKSSVVVERNGELRVVTPNEIDGSFLFFPEDAVDFVR